MPNEKNIMPVLKPSGALQSLVLKASTGAGTAFSLGGAFKEFSIFVVRGATGSSGGSTKANVRLEGSLDGVNYKTLGLSTATNTNSVTGTLARSTNAIAVTSVRLRILSFTTSAGANPDVIPVNGWIAVQGA